MSRIRKIERLGIPTKVRPIRMIFGWASGVAIYSYLAIISYTFLVRLSLDYLGLRIGAEDLCLASAIFFAFAVTMTADIVCLRLKKPLIKLDREVP